MKVPVQKGKITAHVPTMKSMTRDEKNQEDYENRKGRREGQILKSLTKKKK